jgi:hypothetical protein
MPPFESIGSGLASYRVLTISLKDEKGSHYSSLSDIINMANGDIRNNYDKITIEASKFSSITCKPANLVLFPFIIEQQILSYKCFKSRLNYWMISKVSAFLELRGMPILLR